MKTKLSTLLLAFTSILLIACTQQEQSNNSNTATQQEQTSTVTNYIVLTSNIQQIKPISNAAQMLKAESTDNYGKTEVVVCGKTVIDMTNPEIMNPLLEVIEAGNLDVKVCGFTVNMLNVDKSKIPSQLTIVDNGIHYNFKKQHEGYMSLGL